jgi:LysM repeat protein
MTESRDIEGRNTGARNSPQLSSSRPDGKARQLRPYTGALVLSLIALMALVAGCGEGTALPWSNAVPESAAGTPSPTLSSAGSQPPADSATSLSESPTTVASSTSAAGSAPDAGASVPVPTEVADGGATAGGTPASPAQGDRTHTVMEGDTLSGLAEQYYTTVSAIMEANGLTSYLIFVDQVLKIPGPDDVAIAAQAPPASPQQPPITQAGEAAATPTSAEIVVPGATSPNLPQPTVAPPSDPTEAPVDPAPPVQVVREPVVVNGRTYDAYIPAAVKEGQFYQYTCEFDAAWIVLKTYGYDVGLDEMIQAVGLDTSVEPYYEDTADGLIVYGGDIFNYYSGDYKKNFLGRSTGRAMRKAFEAYGLQVTPVNSRPGLEAALLRGELVWIKTTVDFKPWRPVTWVMPDGSTTQGVLGNDHALVVMGFNSEGVVIRDPLGPTSTNWQRQYEYVVPWSRFLEAWGAQQFDGLAVAPPGL